MEPLVSAGWLADNIDDPRLRVFDATIQVRRALLLSTARTGMREWRRAHIPGSGYASLFALSDPHAPRRSLSMPSAAWFAAQLGMRGVTDESRVVLYDRRESMWAARLWWMLRCFGLDDAAVLDGGWDAWRRAGYSVCDIPCGYPPAHAHAVPRQRLVADRAEVLAAIDDPRVCLVNALGRRQHRGEVREFGRRGHIPGSRNVTAWELLDRETGRFRPLPELRDRVGAVLEADRVIVYSGVGVAAASLAHALIRLGHRDVALYDGGLREWNAEPGLPRETSIS